MIPRLAHRLAGGTLLLGAVLAALLQARTYHWADPRAQPPWIWAIYGTLLAITVAAIVASRRGRLPVRRDDGTQESLGVLLLLAYCAATLLVFVIGDRLASPRVVDGKYVLMAHGKLEMELSAEEYAVAEDREARFFLSAGMALCAVFGVSTWKWAADRESTGAWSARIRPGRETSA
jgi:hypothetical protein